MDIFRWYKNCKPNILNLILVSEKSLAKTRNWNRQILPIFLSIKLNLHQSKIDGIKRIIFRKIDAFSCSLLLQLPLS